MPSLENKVVTHITLYADASTQNRPTYVYAKQYDANSRYLVVRIMNSNKDIAVTGTAQLNATKPDGTHSYIAGTANEDGTVTIGLTANLLAVEGKISCDITVFDSADGNQALLTTSTFFILVDESNYDSDAIESTDEFSTVSDALTKIAADRAAAESARDEAVSAAEEAQTTLASKADGLALDGNKLQLMSGTTPLDAAIELPPGVSDLILEQEGDENKLFLAYQGEKIGEGVVLPATGGGGGSTTSTVRVVNNNGVNAMTVAAGNDAVLKFTFTSVENDIPTGNGTCKILVNGIVKTTFSVENGAANEVNVKDLLIAGTNTVKVTCIDVYGNSRSLTYAITVADLSITSTFNDSTVYTDSIEFKYTPYGLIAKTVHFVIDGEEIDTVVTSVSGKQSTKTLSAMAHGVHTLEVYITAVLDGENIESNHLVYAVMCAESDNTTPYIASINNIESVTQGELVSIPYIVYDPLKLECEITLTISQGEDVYSTQTITVDRTKQYWNVRKYPIGDVDFTIAYYGITKKHTITVTESDIDVEPVTDSLELALSSAGRSNNEENPAVWTHGDVTTEFSGVNWKSTGWVTDENGDTALRLNGDARAEIKFQPFKNDIRAAGKTIEFEFAVRDVNKRDAVVISCLSGGIGLTVKADKVILASEQSKVEYPYLDNKKIRIALVVESLDEYRMLSVYLNGTLSNVTQYPTTDNFSQKTPVNISVGSPHCGIDLYSIRCYSTSLTHSDIVNNYIADTTDLTKKVALYDENDVYDDYGKISFEKMSKKTPAMTILGELPQSKGDKKNVIIKWTDPEHPEFDFECEAVIDVQGTSSQWYVVKNYKGTLTEAVQIAVNQILSAIYCMKADYAEGTSTHNTQNANFVHTLYSEKTPAQEADERCRTTIFGFPCVLFHQTAEGATPAFVGKYNMNYDKGSLEVFGFTEQFDVESWEFCNNTSDACNFLGNIPEVWKDDFEARYPEKCTDISRFKIMHDWVVSTKDDIDKFKAEFEEHFDLHFSLIYYVYTFVMLMTDQRAKNMFLTYWGATGKWQPWFYDNDTCLGINNEGQLVFDYYHEDIDTVDGANVYNGQNSVLWSNFRVAFADEIQEMYQELRNSGKLTYEKLCEAFITNGSDKWSASTYNEDSEFKYISMLKSDNDASNLYQVRGKGDEHFRYIVQNRLKYCDSKWYASDYADNYISLRIYTPATYGSIEPNANISIVPFSNMYAGVRYKANGTLQQQRVTADEETTFVAPDETFNDTETAIYGASEISSLCDLAPLYCGSVNISKATKLTELKVGDGAADYTNTNLKSLSVGTNRLLKKLDVRNCPNLTTPLALAECPNIEEIYAGGSGITGVELAEAGYLKILELPSTVTNLTLKNQLYLEEVTLEGKGALKTVVLENCSNIIDPLELLQGASAIERVRMTNVDWAFDDATFLENLIDSGVGGIDEHGVNTTYPLITGKCHISTIDYSSYAKLLEALPYLTITYDVMKVKLVFMSDDGVTELHSQTLLLGESGTDPVKNGDIAQPTRETTAQYTYNYLGWSETQGASEVNYHAVNNVTADRYLYPVFESIVNTYTIRFYNGTTRLKTYTVEYGTIPQYTGTTPTNADEGEFIGWEPAVEPVTQNADYYAKFGLVVIALSDIAYTLDTDNLTLSVTDYIGSAKAVELPSTYTIDDVDYTVTSLGNDAFRSTYIRKIALPNTLVSIGNYALAYMSWFDGELIIPEGVTSIGQYAFANNGKLTKISLPSTATTIPKNILNSTESLETIEVAEGNSVFYTNSTKSGLFMINSSYHSLVVTATKCTEFVLPKDVTMINNVRADFRCRQYLTRLEVEEGHTLYYSEGNCIISKSSKYVYIGCNNSVIPNDVVGISSNAFLKARLTSVNIPEGVTSISNSAFESNSFTSVVLPSALSRLDREAFYYCSNLTTVTFKSTPNTIDSTAFNSCNAITAINVPWAEGEVANAPWGATNATINYNYVAETSEE